MKGEKPVSVAAFLDMILFSLVSTYIILASHETQMSSFYWLPTLRLPSVKAVSGMFLAWKITGL